MPELEAYYHEQLRVHGKQGHVYSPPADFPVLFIDENPDRAWRCLEFYTGKVLSPLTNG